jgi:hypothetical protein
MAINEYTIKFSSSDDSSPSGAYHKASIKVGEKATDTTSTSLTLHGKLSENYASSIWTNMVQMLENFSRYKAPNNSIMGQLWFDSDNQILKVYKVVSESPLTLDYVPVSPLTAKNGIIEATAALIAGAADNNISLATDSSKYLITKSYADSNYVEKGNYDSNSVLVKHKLKYSASVTYSSNDSDKFALVTREYVDGIVGPNLPIIILPSTNMKATKPLLGSTDNGIPASGTVPDGNDPDYNDYFTTRGYSDNRYIIEGHFDNTLLTRQITTKIKYNPQVTYDLDPSSDVDKYTLVHKGYVDYAVQAASEIPTWVKTLSPGIMVSDGTTVSEWTTNAANKVLVTTGTTFQWKDMPSSVAPATAGIVTSNGTTLSSTAYGATNFLLGTDGSKLTWFNPANIGGASQTKLTIPTTAGVVISTGTALTSVASGKGVFVYDGTTHTYQKPTTIGQVLTCTAADGTFSWQPSQASPSINITNDGLVTVTNKTQLSSTGKGKSDQLLSMTSDATGYTWIDRSAVGGGGGGGGPSWLSSSAPDAGIVTSSGTGLSSTKGAANYLLSMNGDASGYVWVNPKNIGGGGGANVTSQNATKSSAISSASGYGSAIAVSKDGQRLVIGAPNAIVYGKRRGMVYVFRWENEDWVEEDVLVASNAFEGDNFGYCVDINADGTRVIVGAPLSDYGSSWDSGAFYIFRRLEGMHDWNEEVFVTGGSGGPQDSTGSAVAISDDGMTIVIGSKDDESEHGASAGWLFVYYMAASGTPGTWKGLSWSSDRHSTYAADQAQVYFGSCVDMDSLGSRYVAGGWGYEKTNKTYGTGSGLAAIYVASGSGFARETYLYPNTADYVKNGEFGWDVAMNADGSRVVISSLMGNTNGVMFAGAVYVFVRTNTTWTQEARLIPDVVRKYSGYGYSVTINDVGDKILVGAVDEIVSGANTGVTYVFTRESNNTWKQIDKLVATDAQAGDNFGSDVACDASGSLMVVGAQFASVGGVSSSGKVYTFGGQSTGLKLSQAIILEGMPVLAGKLGSSVSMSGNGNFMIAGAPYGTYLSKSSGIIMSYYYDAASFSWKTGQIVFSSDAANGDLFGWSVAQSADGSIAVVGAYGAPTGTANNGQVYVFKRSSTGSYTQQAIIKVTGSIWLGYSVDISDDGTTIIAGAPSTARNKGTAYVFKLTGADWTGTYTTTEISAGLTGDNYGWSVALNAAGTRAVIGAPLTEKPGMTNAGVAYVWYNSGSAWSNTYTLTPADAKAGSWFGWSVAMNGVGDRVVVGSQLADSVSISDTGAAYIFGQLSAMAPGQWTEISKIMPAILDPSGNYGWSVAMNAAGDRVIVGAVDTDLPGGYALGGAAYVHSYNAAKGRWETLPLTASNKTSSMNFGSAVSCDSAGLVFAVGARGSKGVTQNTANAGTVYIFS